MDGQFKYERGEINFKKYFLTLVYIYNGERHANWSCFIKCFTL